MLNIMSEDSTLNIEATGEHTELLENIRQQVADALAGKKQVADALAGKKQEAILDYKLATLNVAQIAAVVQYLPERKITAIKEAKAITGLGLREAKYFVDEIMASAGMQEQKNVIAKLRRENARLQETFSVNRVDPHAGLDLRETSEENNPVRW